LHAARESIAAKAGRQSETGSLIIIIIIIVFVRLSLRVARQPQDAERIPPSTGRYAAKGL